MHMYGNCDIPIKVIHPLTVLPMSLNLITRKLNNCQFMHMPSQNRSKIMSKLSRISYLSWFSWAYSTTNNCGDLWTLSFLLVFSLKAYSMFFLVTTCLMMLWACFFFPFISISTGFSLPKKHLHGCHQRPSQF